MKGTVMADIELNEDPASTWGATPEYKSAWHQKYGSSEPAGNAKKDEWVAYAVKQGASQEDAEAMTATELKDTYGGMGIASAPSQGSSTPVASSTTAGSPAPGAGADSGTAAGTADTAGTSSAGARGKA